MSIVHNNEVICSLEDGKILLLFMTIIGAMVSVCYVEISQCLRGSVMECFTFCFMEVVSALEGQL